MQGHDYSYKLSMQVLENMQILHCALCIRDTMKVCTFTGYSIYNARMCVQSLRAKSYTLMAFQGLHANNHIFLVKYKLYLFEKFLPPICTETFLHGNSSIDKMYTCNPLF